MFNFIPNNIPLLFSFTPDVILTCVVVEDKSIWICLNITESGLNVLPLTLNEHYSYLFFFCWSCSRDSTGTRITERQKKKSPQTSDVWPDAEETRKKSRETRRGMVSLVFSQSHSIISLSLLPPPPPMSLSGLPLLVAGGLGHHLQREPLDHCPWWSAYVAVLRLDVAIVMLLSLFVHNKLHQLRGSLRAMKRQIKRTQWVQSAGR